jgi:hypothetical protein
MVKVVTESRQPLLGHPARRAAPARVSRTSKGVGAMDTNHGGPISDVVADVRMVEFAVEVLGRLLLHTSMTQEGSMVNALVGQCIGGYST